MRFIKRQLLTPAPLNPRTLGSLAAWYDVSRIPAAYIDGSNRVSLIPDISGNSDVNAYVSSGAASNTATAANVSTTGSRTFAFDVVFPDYTPGSNLTLVDKLSGNNGFQILLLTTGVVRLRVGDGSSVTNVDSTTGLTLTDATRGQFTIVWTDGVGASFTQNGAALGTAVAAAKTMTNSGAGITLWTSTAGTVYSFTCGTYTFTPSGAAKLAGTFTAPGTGETWTINASGDLGARICGERDLYQATATKQPIYSIGADGRAVVTFDGTDDFMGTSALAGALSFSGGSTVYAVSQRSAATGTNEHCVLYLGNDATYSPNFNWIGLAYQPSTDTTPNAYVSGNYNNPTDKSVKATSAATLNQRYVTIGSTAAAGGTNALYVNRTQYTTASAVAISINASAYLALGRRGNASVGFLNGKFNEGILFNTSFNQATCDRLSLYGGRKWGVTV